jgi:hypothetical protein
MRAFGRLTLVAMLVWASRAQSSAARDAAAPALAGSDSAGTPAVSAAGATAPDTSLTASTAPPWNPPAPVEASETWETVVRTPGIVLSLPLVGLGWVAKSSLSYVESNNLIPHVDALIHFQGKIGLAVLPAAFGDRVGFALGLGFQPPWFPWLNARVAGSTGQYNLANVGLGPRWLQAQYESMWRSKDQFFGLGLDAQKSAVATYASQTQTARLVLEKNWDSRTRGRPAFALSAWAGGRDMVLLDGRDPKKPGIAEIHPVLASELLGVHVEHLIYGGQVALHRRSGSPHWTKGYGLSVRADRFDEPTEGFVLHSPHTHGDQFLRVTYEGQGGISFWRDPRTIRLAVKVVDQTIGSSAGIFILPDLAKLGGQEGLVGFEPGRFQSTDAAVAKLSYIFPLGRYVEVDAHAEAGGVYSDLRDLRGSTLKHSYGTAVRIRSTTRLLGGFGFNWSAESLRFGFQIGGNE